MKDFGNVRGCSDKQDDDEKEEDDGGDDVRGCDCSFCSWSCCEESGDGVLFVTLKAL